MSNPALLRPPSVLDLFVRLLYTPTMLADGACRTTGIRAVLIGATAVSLVLGVATAGHRTVRGAPFVDVFDYGLMFSGCALASGALFWPVIAVLAACIALPAHYLLAESRHRIILRTILLTPSVVFLPALAWSAAGAIVRGRAPWVGFSRSKLPGWASYQVIDVAAWPGWPWLILLLALGVLAWNLVKLRTLPEYRYVSCERCGYSLRGVRGLRCPECGSMRPD